jgi:hypothetical protein
MGTSPAEGRLSGRRGLWAAVAGAVVVALVVLFIVLTGGDDDPSGAAGRATGSTTGPSSASSAAPTTGTSTAPPAPTPTGDPNALPPSLPAVPLDAVGDVGNGVSASIAGVEAIQGEAMGPGNIAGPALRVTVRITNGTSAATSLDGVAVNLAYGSDLTPASPLDDPSQRPFHGSLAPGDAGEGVYVFTVPEDSRDSITIDVGYEAGAPILVFTGSAA